MWFSGQAVKTIAETLKVSTDTIYDDQEYIRKNSNDTMTKYLTDTLPYVLRRSLFQIERANGTACKIMDNPEAHEKDKLSAAMVVSRTARDMIEIVAGNKDVIDKALELDETVNKSEESVITNALLSKDGTQTEEPESDPNAVF